MRNETIRKISVGLLLVWLMVPILSSYLSMIGISLPVLTILLCYAAATSFVRRHSINRYIFYEIVAFISWACLSILGYTNKYMYSHSGSGFIEAFNASYASFFLNVGLVLIPMLFICSNAQQDKRTTRFFLLISLIVIFIDIVFQIRAIFIYPDAVRSPVTARNNGFGYILTGLIEFPQVYSFSLLVPIAYSLYNKDGKQVGVRRLGIVGLVLLMYITLTSNLATAGILALVGLIMFKLLERSPTSSFRFIMAVIMATLMMFFIEDILLWLAEIFIGNETWSRKLLDMSISLSTNEAVGDVEGRTYFYNLSWKAFIESPLFGLIINPKLSIGGHSTVLDILASTGIAGFLSFVFFIFNAYRYCRTTPYYEIYPNSVKATFVSLILMLLLKNTITSFAIYAVMFGALPLFYTIYKMELRQNE